jgi:hypothetical protein
LRDEEAPPEEPHSVDVGADSWWKPANGEYFPGAPGAVGFSGVAGHAILVTLFWCGTEFAKNPKTLGSKFERDFQEFRAWYPQAP